MEAPDQADATAEAAARAYAAGDWAAAYDGFAQAWALYGRAVGATHRYAAIAAHNAGRAALKAGRRADAVAWLQRVRDAALGPADAELRRQTAAALLQCGEPDAACACLDGAADPDRSAAAAQIYARAQAMRGRMDDAEAALLRGAQAAADPAERDSIHADLGALRAAQQRWAEAAAAWSIELEAVESSHGPESARAAAVLLDLGRAYAHAGRGDLAESCLRRAASIHLRADDATAAATCVLALAEALEAAGRHEDALDELTAGPIDATALPAAAHAAWTSAVARLTPLAAQERAAAHAAAAAAAAEELGVDGDEAGDALAPCEPAPSATTKCVDSVASPAPPPPPPLPETGPATSRAHTGALAQAHAWLAAQLGTTAGGASAALAVAAAAALAWRAWQWWHARP